MWRQNSSSGEQMAALAPQVQPGFPSSCSLWILSLPGLHPAGADIPLTQKVGENSSPAQLGFNHVLELGKRSFQLHNTSVTRKWLSSGIFQIRG